MNYYIASENGPLGPYDIEKLMQRGLRPDELVWHDGMAEWSPAADVPELSPVLEASAKPQPPVFDRERFSESIAQAPAQPVISNLSASSWADEYDLEDAPSNYRWLAIIAFLGIIPCAIVAIIFSNLVNRSWEEGKRDLARKQSKRVLLWSIIGIVIGLPLNIFVMSSDYTEWVNNIVSSIVK